MRFQLGKYPGENVHRVVEAVIVSGYSDDTANAIIKAL